MTYTAKAFVQALGNLTISGVTTAFDEPPRQLNAVELPASFPRLPEADNTLAATFIPGIGLRQIVGELVVIFGPYVQGMQAANFSSSLDILDAIHAALTTSAASLGLDGWEMRGNAEQLGDTVYWVLVTRVTGSG